MFHNKNILLIGCGKMGEAMLKGWLKAELPASYYVVEPNSINKIDGIKYAKNFAEIESVAGRNDFFDFIVIAVKPQSFDEVLGDYKIYSRKAVFISIVAGKKIASIQKVLDAKKVIRTMPNLPASIGEGITAIYASKGVNKVEYDCAEQLLKACGDIVNLASEKDFDAVTAVSGSGPAYVFHLVEAMEKAAVKAGLSKEIANILVKKTVSGSAQMAYKATESADVLRKNVTSKAGTTEAALNVLMKKDAMEKLFEKAIKAAKKRSKELNG